MIVVTGACGFIGSNLVRELYNRGEKNILMVDDVQRNYCTDLPILFAYSDEFYNHIDKYLKKGCKTIFHEGAISSTIETDWNKLFKKNVQCTWNLIYYCRDREIPLQYASSASVYGNPTVKEWHNPNKILDPLNLYAKSKQQVDYVADMVMKSIRPPKLIQGMRYFNVYGSNEEHKGDQSSPYSKFKKQLEETGKIRLFEGSEKFLRDFVSVEEVVQKKLEYLENKKSGIYDVGTGKPKSFYEVAVEVGGSPDVIEWIPMPDKLKCHYQSYSRAILD